MIDPGFEGFVIVPPDLIPLDAFLVDQVRWRLGNGSVVESPVYLATLSFVGIGMGVGVLVAQMGDEVIVGRGVTDHFRVTFDHGAQVIIEP
jgi:predicted aspartyl protease